MAAEIGSGEGAEPPDEPGDTVDHDDHIAGLTPVDDTPPEIGRASCRERVSCCV